MTFSASGNTGRMKVGLVIGEGRRAVDISRQPGVVETLLSDAVGPHGIGDAKCQFTARLIDHARDSGCWAPSEIIEATLIEVVGGSAFPLLGASYEHGTLARREVPPWAAEVLGAATARAGATLAFGRRAATKPVVAALARCLVRTGQPLDLGPLAVACMASGVLEPDQLADLLRTTRLPIPGGREPEEPSLEDLRAGIPVCREWGADVAHSVLKDALSVADGLAHLGKIFRAWTFVRPELEGRLPRRLTRLECLVTELQPIDPRPHRERRQPRPRAQIVRHLPPVRPPAEQIPTRPLRPPRTRTQTTPTGFLYPPRLRAIDGANVGDLHIVLPRTATELSDWGSRLDNCLGSFAPAISESACYVIGIEYRSRLLYCLELSPLGRVKQFLGVRNCSPNHGHAQSIVSFLREKSVVSSP